MTAEKVRIGLVQAENNIDFAIKAFAQGDNDSIPEIITHVEGWLKYVKDGLIEHD